MKIPAAKLDQQLARGLSSAYLVSGDEPLLVAESCDRIRAAARAAGFDERELSVVERGFDWLALDGNVSNLSLFSTRRLIELRLATARPGEAGAKALLRLLEQPDPDRLLLVVTPKLDAAASRTKWVRGLEEHGVHVQIWPLDRGQLPGWISRRAAGLGMRLDRDAVTLLVERTEGNLLAAAQELDKLAMLLGPVAVDEAAVLAAVADSARFDVFGLSDAVLVGDGQRALRILGTLQREGVEPVLVLWSLARDAALLARLRFALGAGEQPARAMQQQGVWRRRQPLVSKALSRLSGAVVVQLQQRVAVTDRVIKGVQAGAPWDALADLALQMAQPRAAA